MSTQPAVEVVQRGEQLTLGGDIDAMVLAIRERFSVTAPAARALLSDACERIESACEEADLRAVTFEDVLGEVNQILEGW